MISPIRPREYSAEERELLNLVLRDLLSIYGEPFGVITHVTQTDADPVELLQNAPGIIDVLEAAGHYKKGSLSRDSALWLQTLIDQLVSTLVRKDAGDEFAEKQIEAVQKLLDPETYGGIQITVLEELIQKHHTRPALARAWAIRSLMGRLSWGVEANTPGAGVLDGKIKLTTSEHLKKETTYWHEYGEWRTAYDVASDHWPKRGAPTLKSLAVKVYLKQLEREGFTTISEASLEGDLQELAEWERRHPKEIEQATELLIFNLGGPNQGLPWMPYSEGWKRSGHYEQNKEAANQLRKRRGKKTQIKKGGKKTETLPP